MKKLIFITALLFSLLTTIAQISATTSGGKKVVLNMDGTWRWEEPGKPIQEKSCLANHTGNISVKNNSNYDVYFYYSKRGVYGDALFVKIAAKNTKTISDLESGAEYDNVKQYKWAWKATQEMQKSGETISRMQGIVTGQFVINDCELTELEIDN